MTSGARYHFVATSASDSLSTRHNNQHNSRRTLSKDEILILVRFAFHRMETSGEAKITNNDFAVFIQEDVARFQISMDHICRVYVLSNTRISITGFDEV